MDRASSAATELPSAAGVPQQHATNGLPTTARPCRSFPGESEEFYCSQCFLPCSALSLLVGDHTNHPRRRLDDAYETAPTDIAREAAELDHTVHRFVSSVERTADAYTARHATISHRLDDVCEAIRRLEETKQALEHELLDHEHLFEEDVRLQRCRVQELRRFGTSLRRASEEWSEMYEEELHRYRAGVRGWAAASGISPAMCSAAVDDLRQVQARLGRSMEALLSHRGQQQQAPRRAMFHNEGNEEEERMTFQPYDDRRETTTGRHHAPRGDPVGINSDVTDFLKRRTSPTTTKTAQTFVMPTTTGVSGMQSGSHVRQTVTSSRSDIDRTALLLLQRQKGTTRFDDPVVVSAAAASRTTQPHPVPAAAAPRDRLDVPQRPQPYSASSSSSSLDGADSPSVQGVAATGGGAALIRHAHHLVACLSDALTTHQPAAVVQVFTRGLRQLRSEAILIGCLPELEAIVRSSGVSKTSF